MVEMEQQSQDALKRHNLAADEDDDGDEADDGMDDGTMCEVLVSPHAASFAVRWLLCAASPPRPPCSFVSARSASWVA